MTFSFLQNDGTGSELEQVCGLLSKRDKTRQENGRSACVDKDTCGGEALLSKHLSGKLKKRV